MLNFIWHMRGSVALDRVASHEQALDRLERLLDQQQKTFATRGATFLDFDDPLWSNPFSSGSKAMAIYDRGHFWIEQTIEGRSLRYDLRSLHGFVFCLIGSLTLFLFAGFGGGSLIYGLKVAAAAFAWLYGANIILALVRIPFAIRKAVRTP